jgi:leucyl-tRNA synthetase
VPYDKLPVILPDLDDYRPDKIHPVPLSKAESWKHVLINNKKYIRELQTMPGSAGSS